MELPKKKTAWDLVAIIDLVKRSKKKVKKHLGPRKVSFISLKTISVAVLSLNGSLIIIFFFFIFQYLGMPLQGTLSKPHLKQTKNKQPPIKKIK